MIARGYRKLVPCRREVRLISGDLKASPIKVGVSGAPIGATGPQKHAVPTPPGSTPGRQTNLKSPSKFVGGQVDVKT